MFRTVYYGNPFLGLFFKASNRLALAPIDAQEKNVESIKEKLGVDCALVSVAGSNLIGIYTAMNSNGIIVPNIMELSEIAILKKAGLNVYVSGELNNAHGNNLCVNDKGGLVNPRIDSAEKKKMEDALGVELVAMEIAKYPTVGSICVTTNKGFLVHYSASEDEIKLAGEALHVQGSRGTLNGGVGFLGVCTVHNDKGFVAGESTTGFELGKAESELGYL